MVSQSYTGDVGCKSLELNHSWQDIESKSLKRAWVSRAVCRGPRFSWKACIFSIWSELGVHHLQIIVSAYCFAKNLLWIKRPAGVYSTRNSYYLATCLLLADWCWVFSASNTNVLLVASFSNLGNPYIWNIIQSTKLESRKRFSIQDWAKVNHLVICSLMNSWNVSKPSGDRWIWFSDISCFLEWKILLSKIVLISDLRSYKREHVLKLNKSARVLKTFDVQLYSYYYDEGWFFYLVWVLSYEHAVVLHTFREMFVFVLLLNWFDCTKKHTTPFLVCECQYVNSCLWSV